MRVALGVEYLGTAYCGWQFQSHCDSVQKHVQSALTFIANEPIDVHCAGRTDTGVHAIGQVVHFDTKSARRGKAWVQGANTQLPYDIRIIWAKEVPEDFHARFSAFARQYRYAIFNRPVHSAVLSARTTWERQPLDEVAMHEAAQNLVGEKDFSSFRAAGCQAKHAMREVKSIQVNRHDDFVFVDIQANAFLHHMVRNIVGTLLEVGRGERPIDWVRTLLDKQDRTQAGITAPAEGLYFVNALYPEKYGLPLTPLNAVLWQG